MSVEGQVPRSRHYGIATAAFTLFIIYGSLVPLTTRSLSWDRAVDRFAIVMSRQPEIASKSDWAANVLLFVPLGFLAAGAIGVDRKRPLLQVALIPLMTALSAAIEFAQLWFPDRNSSINDVAAESIGGAVGVGAWLWFGQAATARLRAAWAWLGPGDWAAKALPAYLLFLVFVHGMPFDLTLSPLQIKKKYDNGREIDAEATHTPHIALAPRPALVGEKTLQNVAYFLPVGALLAALPGVRWRSADAAGRVLVCGFAIAGAIETVQLFVLSCGTYASDVLCAGLLVLLGWWLTVRVRPMSTSTWMALAATWTAALVLVFWSPFDALDAPWQRFEWMPFADYVAGNYIAGFNRIINKTVVFAPLGFAIHRARKGPSWSAWVVGVAVAVAVEIGQAAFTEHPASISDVILGAVGTGISGLIATRAAAANPPAAPAPGRFIFYDGVR
jgi:VanZ family protein